MCQKIQKNVSSVQIPYISTIQNLVIKVRTGMLTDREPKHHHTVPKSSQAISCVNVELKTNISEISISIRVDVVTI
jgi:flagellar motor switch protein FliM